MKEFMFIIRNNNTNFSSLSPADQEQFLQKCMIYINDLKKEGKLIAAQPLAREGKIISRPGEGENGKKPLSMKEKKCRLVIITSWQMTSMKLLPLQREILNLNMVQPPRSKFVR